MDLTNFGVKIENKQEFIRDEILNPNYKKIFSQIKIKKNKDNLPWFLKYGIVEYEDLIKTKEIIEIEKYLENPKSKKPFLLYGLTGTGKTTSISILAKHYDYEIFELNASDVRAKNAIREILLPAIKEKSLTFKKRLILLDEIDGISGNSDRGGVLEIIKILKNSNLPIILTANNIDKTSLKPILKIVKKINFENSLKEILFKFSNKILKNENVIFDEKDLLKFIEKRNPLDIRGFINDLQFSVLDKKFVPSDEIVLRDYVKKIEEVLLSCFYTYPEKAYHIFLNSDISIDDMFLYLEENIPKFLSKKAINLTLNELSKADVFKGRILRNQHWRFLVYESFYLSFGVSTFKYTPKKLQKITRNSRILKMWIYSNKLSVIKQKNKETKLSLIENLKQDLHLSSKKFFTSQLDFIKYNLKFSNKFRCDFQKKYNLENFEIQKLIN